MQTAVIGAGMEISWKIILGGGNFLCRRFGEGRGGADNNTYRQMYSRLIKRDLFSKDNNLNTIL